MTALIERLKDFKKSVNLEKRFDYKFNHDNSIFSDQEKNELCSVENNYQKNLLLKELIKDKSNGSYSQTDLNFWIINEWGGIKTFKKNAVNINRIETFSKQLLNSKLTIDTFGTISSLSKISSFIDPDNYAIYDSRVIYSLNWLILTTNPKELKFFPMPSGRNKKIIDFDINTIIRTINIEKYCLKDNLLFYDHKTAYFKYCELIKSISKLVFDDKSVMPYHLEMLLFTIANVEIFDELTKRIKIKINY